MTSVIAMIGHLTGTKMQIFYDEGSICKLRKVHDFRAKKSSKEGFNKSLMLEDLTMTGQCIGTKVQIFCL